MQVIIDFFMGLDWYYALLIYLVFILCLHLLYI